MTFRGDMSLLDGRVHRGKTDPEVRWTHAEKNNQKLI